MSVMKSVLRACTWWQGQTLNTQLFTWRNGLKVGIDEQGNTYYQNADDSRRWVIFKGEIEASRISPDWHGWLHHTWKDPPNVTPLKRKIWEKAHQENLTGTESAYAPAGSLRVQSPKPVEDYEAWRPEG